MDQFLRRASRDKCLFRLATTASPSNDEEVCRGRRVRQAEGKVVGFITEFIDLREGELKN